MVIEIINYGIQVYSAIGYYLFHLWTKTDYGATRLKDIITIIVFFAGTLWAAFKVMEFREFKYKIQFEIDANIYKLDIPIASCTKSYNKQKNLACRSPELCTHLVEILFIFINNSNRRFRLYNLQAVISTMPDKDRIKDKIRNDDCGLSLHRLHTSGNIVPEKVGFYYIEPGIKQIISYLCIIRQPDEILQVRGCFSLEQQRLFPKEYVGPMRLHPHTAERTYKLNSDGKCSCSSPLTSRTEP